MDSKTIIYGVLLLALAALCQGFVPGTKIKSDCELPKYKGPCRGHFQAIYFDMKSRECKPFVWSGCGGNGNRFYSLDECQFACHYYMELPK